MRGGARVTFVGHDASRTGAPTVLRSLLRWGVANRSVRPHLVLLRGGPLVEDFAALVPTTVTDVGVGHGARTAVRTLRAVRPDLSDRVDHALAPRSIRSGRPDVVVASSIAALAPTVAAIDGACPIVCHVHELDGVADRILPPPGPRRDALLAATSRFVAAGPAVAGMLVDRWRLPASKVVVVDEFIDPPDVAPEDTSRARRDLGVAPDALLLVGAGVAGPRKGIDYFVDVVATLGTHAAAPSAAWIGGDPASSAWSQAHHDIAAARLGGRVRLVPTVDDAVSSLAAADVFLTTAREDPYPLVVLEAAAVATPVVGFAAGGFAHVATDVGLPHVAVPVGDVLGLSDRLAGLLDSPTERARHGRLLAEWVRATHLTEHQAPRLWDAIVESA